eukprot:TRINITY_DN5676_c0_g1_i2.p1 TRINITY_DN5676_c0_g1~~TRINITY_DN5676_c0_g1_i2.p1  ORF type:complete len:448 (-),score=95.94 TRINITY_DN5676_c0_g1_i2:32-1375(-)
MNNNIKILTRLLSNPLVIPSVCKSGNTALHLAAASSNEALQLLVHSVNLDPNPTFPDGTTPLHVAAKNFNFDGVKILLELGQRIVIQSTDSKGYMPVHYLIDSLLENSDDNLKEIEEKGSNLLDCVYLLLNQEIQQDPKKKYARSIAQRLNEYQQHKYFGTLFSDYINEIPLDIGSKLQIQICSDLHIEFGHPTGPLVQPVCKYLGLLGDIGVPLKDTEKYKEFLFHMAEQFELVFVLLGNHEFYHGNVSDLYSTVEDICSQREQLVFMNQKSMVINNVRIIGPCLWSYIPDDKICSVNQCLSDYRYIHTEEDGVDRLLTPDDTVKWHTNELEFINNEIKEAKLANQKTLVLTHHGPVLETGCSNPEYWYQEACNAFSSDIIDINTKEPNVDVWAYGHTHWFHDMVVGGTRIVSNPHGYPDYNCDVEEYDHRLDESKIYNESFTVTL